MRGKSVQVMAVGLLSLGFVIANPAGAGAAKVSDTASGGAVPPGIANPAPGQLSTPLVQRFRFGGPKLKGVEIVDVDVTVSASGNGPGSNAELAALLVDPKGDVDQAVDPKGGSVPLPIPKLGSAMSHLRFDDKSTLIPCNPFDPPPISNCNLLQGGNRDGEVGTMTGNLNASISSAFEDSKPKGTWKLIWRDANANPVTTTVESAKLRLRTRPK